MVLTDGMVIIVRVFTCDDVGGRRLLRSLCLWLWASSFFDLVPGELLAPLPITLAQLVLGALGADLLDLVPGKLLAPLPLAIAQFVLEALGANLLDLVPGKLIPSPPTLVQLVL